MANKNDERILELKKQIEDKKSKLGSKIKRFIPLTNMSLELDGSRLNINVLNKDQLIKILVILNSYLISATDLEVEDEFILSGYKLAEWISDIKNRLYLLNTKEEEKILAGMESKLSKMLSDEKQVELELDEMSSFLKDE